MGHVGHARFVNPLRELRQPGKPWDWNHEHERAYDALKKNFVESIQLRHYDLTRPFRLQTDGSDSGICGVLYQVDENGNHQVISLVSRCLTSAEQNYTTTERELLAVVYSVEKLRVYLIGRSFTIITDHHALTFLTKSPFHTPRLARWNLCLQEYDFSIEYCRGVDNVVADFFSRHPDSRFHEQSSKKFNIFHMLCCDDLSRKTSNDLLVSIKFMELNREMRQSLKNIKSMQQQDQELIRNYRMKLLEEKNGGELAHCYKGIGFSRNEVQKFGDW